MAQGLLTLVPTRNRVKNALGLLHTFFDMSGNDDSGLLFIVGTEDPSLTEYVKKIPQQHLLIFPERGLVKALNYAVSCGYAEEYEGLAFMGDDHRPRTYGWDQSYLDNLRELRYGYVYGNDLLMGERIPTQVAISSSIIRALGFFGPPGFTHLNVDLTWKDMGEALGKLRYLPDVIVEHMHPAASKAENDSGYKWANSSMMVKLDGIEYERWKREDFRNQVHQVTLAHGC